MKIRNVIRFVAISFLATATYSVILNTPAFAKEVCFTQYGGGETCVDVEEDGNINVDKKVSKEDKNYENHIQSSTHKFEAEDSVYFKIKVENTGNVDLKNVELKDVLPDFLSYDKMLDGPSPKDKDGSTIKWDLGSLDKGESETIKFVAKVADESYLPVDDKVCLTNVAKAKGEREDNEDKEEDADYANFCIELGDVLGEEAPTELPKAGNSLTLAIAGLTSIVSGAVYKKKFTK
jgi:uncharacterized repeat protein (TIGR01451 family)